MQNFTFQSETPDPKPIKVASISVTADKTELTVGDTMQAAATVLPENADNKEVTWTSSNESAVTVNESGLIKAIGVGSADIIATAKRRKRCNRQSYHHGKIKKILIRYRLRPLHRQKKSKS